VVVIAVAAVIFLQSGTNAGSSIDYSDIPQSRTDDGGFVLGDPDAPVTIVAFEDFLCPHCQSYQTEVHQFIEEYVATGKARFEFRYVPTQQNAQTAAALAECSVQFDISFWEAHDKLFDMASTRFFDGRSVRQFAEDYDLNYNDLLECMEDANQYQVDGQLASQVGVQGTPTVLFRIGDSQPQPLPIGQAPSADALGDFIDRVQATS
jgi:protein-disulfide isomerase